MASQSGTPTTAAAQSALPLGPTDNQGSLQVSGTFTGVTGSVQVTSDPPGTSSPAWNAVTTQRSDTQAWETTTTFTDSTNRTYSFNIPPGTSQIRFNISAGTLTAFKYRLNTVFSPTPLLITGALLAGGNQAGLNSLTLTALGTTQSSAPTSAQLLGGFLTQTSATGAGAVTLPTGTALSAACPRTPVTGDYFSCVFANLGGGQTLTITGATGTTVISGGAIATATAATVHFICTGANTWSIAVE